MFRFAKIDGSNFNLDEVGFVSIAAFDSGNDKVAVCLVNPKQLEEDFQPMSVEDCIDIIRDPEGEGHKFVEDGWVGGNPEDVDHWNVLLNVGEKARRVIALALVSGYSALRLCEYMSVVLPKKIK